MCKISSICSVYLIISGRLDPIFPQDFLQIEFLTKMLSIFHAVPCNSEIFGKITVSFQYLLVILQANEMCEK